MKFEILKNTPNAGNIGDYIEKSQNGISDSRTQIHRFMRLTELIKPLQEKVNLDKLPVVSGAEISFLTEDEQEIVNQVIEDEQVKLSLVQAQKIKMKKHSITYETVLKIVKNEKEKKEKFTGKLDRKTFKEYKDRFNSDKEFSILIKQLLDDYFRSDSDDKQDSHL